VTIHFKAEKRPSSTAATGGVPTEKPNSPALHPKTRRAHREAAGKIAAGSADRQKEGRTPITRPPAA